MARAETVSRERRVRTVVWAGSGIVVAIALAVMVVAGVAGMLAGRSVTAPYSPRVSGWERALQIGDEARARGDASSARRAYLSALFRARGERSLPGVLGAGERFTALGDREVVGQVLSMASSLRIAEADAETQRRLEALRDQLRASDTTPLTVRAPR